MFKPVSQALEAFTERYIELWKIKTGHAPESVDLHGIDSPCIIKTTETTVQWLPSKIIEQLTLKNIAHALDICLAPEISSFYTTQYAGDMSAIYEGQSLTLLQAWNADDFIRLQENLIGHLVTQRRLKLKPTLFIATIDSDMEMISFCNLTGNIILEKFGTKEYHIIAPDLVYFLQSLSPVVV